MSNVDQTFLLEHIIEILKTTSKENPIQKQRIIERNFADDPHIIIILAAIAKYPKNV